MINSKISAYKPWALIKCFKTFIPFNLKTAIFSQLIQKMYWSFPCFLKYCTKMWQNKISNKQLYHCREWQIKGYFGIDIFIVFEIAAIPFHCNGILVVVGNLPSIFPMSSLIFASFYPFFQFIIYFYWEWPSFGFQQVLKVFYSVPDNNNLFVKIL